MTYRIELWIWVHFSQVPKYSPKILHIIHVAIGWECFPRRIQVGSVVVEPIINQNDSPAFIAGSLSKELGDVVFSLRCCESTENDDYG